MSFDLTPIALAIVFLGWVWYKKGISITVTKKEVHKHSDPDTVIMQDKSGKFEQISVEEAQKRMDENATNNIVQTAMQVLNDYLGDDAEVPNGTGTED